MNGLPNLYDPQYAAMDPQSGMNGYAQDGNVNEMGASPLDSAMMGQSQPQTLDQIINQNQQELMRRRRTYAQQQHHQQSQQSQQQQQQQQQKQQQQSPRYRQGGNQEHARRASMMEFSSNSNSDLADFQFDPSPAQNSISNSTTGNNVSAHNKLDPRRVRSREDLALDTGFSPLNTNYEPMSVTGAYNPALMSSTAMGMDPTSAFLPQNVDGSMDFDAMSTDVANMNVHGGSNQQNMFSASPMAQSFQVGYPSSNTDHTGGSNGTSASNSQMMSLSQSGGSTPQKMLQQQQKLRRNQMVPSPLSMSQDHRMNGMNGMNGMNSMQSPAHLHQSHSRRQSMDVQSPFSNNQINEVSQDHQVMQHQQPHQRQQQPTYSKYQTAYSTSGFDMLGVLMRVATRRNPEISIGPVDLSCAFVVCDIAKHDLPIVYCSDMFERLTGYTRFEILGRNCRFLQAPDGKVQSGQKRKYVDDKSVLYLKNQINRRAEAQLSLINYRKGGQPFMNLLTMIPIPWDTEEFKYYVGFQVDLVEQPNSVSAKNPDGTYEINYNRSALPAYQLPAPDSTASIQELGQTISRDEVSQVLTTIGNGESDLSKRIWDKVLLENTDDVVHVLSLKGLFQYLSPACRKILEYDPTELVGNALSSVCHPSDIVPVTRELKDSANGATVNVVYRIRRKHSGYTWFEAHGCLHTEQGKGRKCIILVGRQRPVYALEKDEIANDGGIGDSELWTKMSTTGMFLFVSTNSRSMLDRLPEDLVGVSMQSLMRPESKKEFNRVLELARTGERSTFKHDLQNRRGQVLQAQTTIYPGDSKKGCKPSFLLAQTRLLKMTRAMLLNQQKTGPTSTPKTDASLGSATPFSQAGNQGNQTPQVPPSGSSTPAPIFEGESGILTQAGGSGLPLGNQDELLASEENIFDELKTTRSTSWQFELRQMERQNRLLAEELQSLLSRKKKRKRRKGLGQLEKDCANCHTRVTPEWGEVPVAIVIFVTAVGFGGRSRYVSPFISSGYSANRRKNGRVSPRGKAGSARSDKSGASPAHAQIANQSASKENSAGTNTSVTPASGESQQGSQTPMRPPKQERDSSSKGSMPPAIEEGQEPPHPNVLPT